MLVLLREVGQEIVIETSDGPIKLIVSDVRSERVKLAFDAPESVRIYRREVWDQVQHEQEQRKTKGTV